MDYTVVPDGGGQRERERERERGLKRTARKKRGALLRLRCTAVRRRRVERGRRVCENKPTGPTDF